MGMNPCGAALPKPLVHFLPASQTLTEACVRTLGVAASVQLLAHEVHAAAQSSLQNHLVTLDVRSSMEGRVGQALLYRDCHSPLGLEPCSYACPWGTPSCPPHFSPHMRMCRVPSSCSVVCIWTQRPRTWCLTGSSHPPLCKVGWGRLYRVMALLKLYSPIIQA